MSFFVKLITCPLYFHFIFIKLSTKNYFFLLSAEPKYALHDGSDGNERWSRSERSIPRSHAAGITDEHATARIPTNTTQRSNDETTTGWPNGPTAW